MSVYRPRIDSRPAPEPRTAAGRWQGCARRPSLIGPETLRLLNVEHSLEHPADWNRRDWPRLWLYNLHYFDDLAADNGAERLPWQRELMRRWKIENPPANGVGWEPYPTSLRIVNWIKWALAGNTFDADALQSLAIQTRWLRKHLEFHLLGNHLWANAKALVFAGVFFSGDEPTHRFTRGLGLLKHELAEQILPDGGHFERSPMYHALVVEDLLDLVQLATLYPALFDATDHEHWRKVAAHMLHWLRVMTHPDGGIALFNDAALGVAPDYAALAAYAKHLHVPTDEATLKPLEVLADSGYVRMQQGDAVLIADVGRIGPDYQPGHAHADTLSFELSFKGKRLLVNGGTSTYEPGEERLRQRGTAAHNTVTLNDQDSSEVWAAFRVGRRARPHNIEWGETSDGLWLRAAHNGYAHLLGHPWHRREWRLSPTGLSVHDRIDGRFGHAEARYHIAPDWGAETTNAGRGSLTPKNGAPTIQWQARPGPSITAESYHPSFFLGYPSQVIELPLDRDGATFTLEWR